MISAPALWTSCSPSPSLESKSEEGGRLCVAKERTLRTVGPLRAEPGIVRVGPRLQLGCAGSIWTIHQRPPRLPVRRQAGPGSRGRLVRRAGGSGQTAPIREFGTAIPVGLPLLQDRRRSAREEPPADGERSNAATCWAAPGGLTSSCAGVVKHGRARGRELRRLFRHAASQPACSQRRRTAQRLCKDSETMSLSRPAQCRLQSSRATCPWWFPLYIKTPVWCRKTSGTYLFLSQIGCRRLNCFRGARMHQQISC